MRFYAALQILTSEFVGNMHVNRPDPEPAPRNLWGNAAYVGRLAESTLRLYGLWGSNSRRKDWAEPLPAPANHSYKPNMEAKIVEDNYNH